METDTVTGPACWASALINGDDSSFSLDEDGGAAEIAALDAWASRLAADGWSVVSVVEGSERFTWSYRLHGGMAEGGEVCDYIVRRDKREG